MASKESGAPVLVHPHRHPVATTRSPWHPTFVGDVLQPLMLRHLSGESPRELSLELYRTIHPWAMSQANAQSSRAPASADRQEIASQVIRLTWEACLHIDWARYEAWPAFLDSKVSRAGAEAARSDDWLSRRERVVRRHFQSEVSRREQHEHRSLTDSERRTIASEVAPPTARVDWTAALLAARHPSLMGEVPDVSVAATVEELVEDHEIGNIRTRCLTDWLRIVATTNERLATELAQWALLDDGALRALPERLAQRVQPYTPLLLAMLADAA